MALQRQLFVISSKSRRAIYLRPRQIASIEQVRLPSTTHFKQRHAFTPLREAGFVYNRAAARHSLTIGNSIPLRHVSTTSRTSKPISTTISSPPNLTQDNTPPSQPPITTNPSNHPLATLPLSSLIRTCLITTLSSRPLLLTTTITLLQSMLSSRNPLFSVTHNPFLHWLLKRTFYAQFCAGEDSAEVSRFVHKMEKVGYSGVALEYASEVLEDDGPGSAADEVKGIERWERGILDSIEMSREGSFVAFKYSGMGPSTLLRLKANLPPTPLELAALHKICDAAAAKRIRVSPAAEPQNAQKAVNDWTLDLARIYNRASLSKYGAPPALIYNTYQCYLISTPVTLMHDIALAERENFTLGVKLVRGAYLATERRELIHATKAETDAAYDGIAEAFLRGRFTATLARKQDGTDDGVMKRVDVLLATHNAETVNMALRVRAERLSIHATKSSSSQPSASQPQQALNDLSFAQLQGMADEVSCALLAAQKRQNTSFTSMGSTSPTSTNPTASPRSPTHETFCKGPSPHVYKYCNWGTLSECLAYLTRRAAENRDAAGRTRNTALAMREEIVRRLAQSVGL